MDTNPFLYTILMYYVFGIFKFLIHTYIDVFKFEEILLIMEVYNEI